MSDVPVVDLRGSGTEVQRRGLVAEVAGIHPPPSVVLGDRRAQLDGLTAIEIVKFQHIIKVVEVWLHDHADEISRNRKGEIKVSGWQDETRQWFSQQGITVSMTAETSIAFFADEAEAWAREKKAAIARQAR